MTLAFDESFKGEEMDWGRWNTNYPWNARTHNYNGFADRGNSFLQDDRLILKAEAKPQEGKDYTTGVISTDDDFSTGYIEGRIWVPPPLPGFWPAFWLTPGDYWPPEIDIFEFFGTDPCAKMTYHYWDYEDNEKVEARGEFCDRDFHTGFYDYGIDWTEDRIVWYIDGEERFRTEGDHVKSDPLTLIINFGIDSGFLNDPREEDLPAYLGVDWVRIWQR